MLLVKLNWFLLFLKVTNYYLHVFYCVTEYNLSEVDMGSRTHNCEFCGKYFKQLSRHQKKTCYWNPVSESYGAWNDKPFSCKDCGASYVRKGRLNYHSRHECGKIQKCQTCGDTFLYLSGLREHQKRCTPQ